jgi:hypothetical protein
LRAYILSSLEIKILPDKSKHEQKLAFEGRGKSEDISEGTDKFKSNISG